MFSHGMAMVYGVLVYISFNLNQFERSQIRAARHQHQADAALQPRTVIPEICKVTTKLQRNKAL